MRERQNGGLRRDEGFEGREFSSSVHPPCQLLEEVRDVLDSSPGQPRGLVRTQDQKTL